MGARRHPSGETLIGKGLRPEVLEGAARVVSPGSRSTGGTGRTRLLAAERTRMVVARLPPSGFSVENRRRVRALDDLRSQARPASLSGPACGHLPVLRAVVLRRTRSAAGGRPGDLRPQGLPGEAAGSGTAHGVQGSHRRPQPRRFLRRGRLPSPGRGPVLQVPGPLLPAPRRVPRRYHRPRLPRRHPPALAVPPLLVAAATVDPRLTPAHSASRALEPREPLC